MVSVNVNGSPTPPGTLRRMGYPSPPSLARQILQIHREKRKQPHECPERGSVAHQSGLYKWHLGPPGAPFVMGIKMERSAVSQPQQGIKHSALSSRSRTLPLRKAPLFTECMLYGLFYKFLVAFLKWSKILSFLTTTSEAAYVCITYLCIFMMVFPLLFRLSGFQY